VTSKYLRFLIKPILPKIKIADPLPEEMTERYKFPSLDEAIRTIHYPNNLGDADKAKERFAFDDLLLFQIKSLLERRKMNQLKSIPISFNENSVKEFVASLPFELTRDQRVAAYEILKDLEKSYPMNRLLEGDVGSGKTVVALIGALQAAQSGHQAAFLAPTEVLAQQHYATISELIKDTGIYTGLLTASVCKFNNEAVKKAELKKEIANGNIKILVGTHAVIQKDIEFRNLVLVVVDEQHRFGINQRATLVKRTDIVPHLLSMTATPIPRTLALTIYGDLDISIIKEKPKNRQKIITQIILPEKRKEAYEFIRKEVTGGRQIFVICPRIELSDPQKAVTISAKQQKMNILWADVKAVEDEYNKLSKEIFPDLRVAMLHGKLKPIEKQSVMTAFKNREYDILVSTSVVEVGVDVPNATVMMIESAERFGLAQLHQFRGRVGRSENQSYCLLLSSTNQKTINQRLKALVECDDGFLLAEKDMKIRGPGEFFGVKQSGLPDLAMASLANVDLIKKARFEARTLLKDNPSLSKYPLLKDRLEHLQRMVHFEQLIFPYFRRYPESHIFSQHQAGLGIQRREGAQKYRRRRKYHPLDDHPEVFKLAVSRRTGR
jgi:ATP-dependent DNA helicase RecG